MKKRRVKRFQFDPEILPSLFLDGLKFEIIKGIPKDSVLKGFHLDAQTNTIMIFMEHPSFEEIGDGYTVPLAHAIQLRALE